MIRTASILALAAFLFAVLSVPGAAVAAEHDSLVPSIAWDAQEGEGNTADNEGWGFNEAVVWTLAGLAIFALIMGALYYFKRQVGAFPENPSWVAPITIMPSREFPDEGDYGDQVPSDQAHAEH